MSSAFLTKPPVANVAIEAVKRIRQPLLLYGIIESILLVFVLVVGRALPDGLLPVVYTLMGFPVIIAISHFILGYRALISKYTVKKSKDEMLGLEVPQNTAFRLLPSGQIERLI